jgi:hypothetical protein
MVLRSTLRHDTWALREIGQVPPLPLCEEFYSEYDHNCNKFELKHKILS